MKESDVTLAQWIVYSLIIVFVLFANIAFSQIQVTHFNAGWNEANDVPWFMELEDCKTMGTTDIAKNPDEAKKYKIAVVPTIIVFKDGEEALRFQADLSFKMVATKNEVQEAIDELLMSDF
jgi:hypothetical protein